MGDPAKRDLRKFGLRVGAVFVLLGVVSWVRGHTLAPRFLWTVAACLVVPALLAPALLRPVERLWMSGAALLGHVNTRIILTVLFYVVLTPVGLMLRLVRDPLNRRLDPSAGSNWVRRAPQPVDPARYQEQF